MRLMRWVILLVLGAGMAAASDLRPAEVPPADFVSRQYIDSSGCVFLRDEAGGWAPRVSRDGAPICGYPPTLSARGIDGKPRLRALDPNAGRSRAELLEQALSETVLTNMRPGELASDPNPMEKLPDLGPEPAPSGPVDAIKAALTAAPAVRNNMGEALQPNRRLCELLGYDDGRGAPALGDDPSQGYCSSLPESDLSRLTFIRPLGEIRQADGKPSQNGGADATPAKGETAQSEPKGVAVAAPETASPLAKASESGKPVAANRVPRAQTHAVKLPKPVKHAAETAKTPAAPKPTTPKAMPAGAGSSPVAPVSPGLIPPGARYIQFGTYADAANADRAAQLVAGMGYSVMRGRDAAGGRNVQFILAGPFDDRETIVRALDAIRRAGFRDAYPR